MLRGGYIARCHVPSEEIMGTREAARSRKRPVAERTYFKNPLQGIAGRRGIKTARSGLATLHMTELRGIGDAHIGRYPGLICCLGGETGRQTGRSQARPHPWGRCSGS